MFFSTGNERSFVWLELHNTPFGNASMLHDPVPIKISHRSRRVLSPALEVQLEIDLRHGN